LNQAVSVTQDYEVNEKAVNQIHLLSLMQQGGELTENQVNALQSIAQQDPKQGGPAVHTALGLLQDCAKPEIEPQYMAVKPGTYSEHVQIAEDRESDALALAGESKTSIFPNPTSSSFIVRNPRGNPGILTLTDITGKIWMKQAFSGQEATFEISSGTPSGAYFLKMTMGDGTSAIEKIIIQSN
jgi:hypothetical protein